MYMWRKKLPEVLNSYEASKLLSIPNPRYPTGLRNLAIMTVMINIGLRVSEVSNLKPGNINLTEGKLQVVNGKGGGGQRSNYSQWIYFRSFKKLEADQA